MKIVNSEFQATFSFEKTPLSSINLDFQKLVRQLIDRLSFDVVFKSTLVLTAWQNTSSTSLVHYKVFHELG